MEQKRTKRGPKGDRERTRDREPKSFESVRGSGRDRFWGPGERRSERGRGRR